MKKNMLRILTKDELNNIFDEPADKIIKYFIKKNIFNQPERKSNQKEIPFYVPHEHIEQWIVQAVGGKAIGAGHYPVDIILPNRFASDIKMVSCTTDDNDNLKNNFSGETSLAQNFKDGGLDLDTLFKTENSEEIIHQWKKILKEKLETLPEIHAINNKLLYLIILKGKLNFYICGFEVNINNIDNVSAGNFTRTKQSLMVNNLIDEIYGQAKIYKAKKRLELRLRPKAIVDFGHAKKYNLNSKPNEIDLRELVMEGKFEEYKKQELRKFF